MTTMVGAMKILVGSEKGGTGKTTFATNLAVWLALGGRDVLLLDADRQGTARKWSDRRDPALVPRVHCMQRSGRLGASVRDAASRYDDVIIDSGGADSPELRSAMLVVDALVVPCQASVFDLETMAHVLELLDAAQASNEGLQAHVFLSRAPTNQRREQEEAMAALRELLPDTVHIHPTVIYDRRSYRDAGAAGQGVVEWQDAKARQEFDALAEALITFLASKAEAAA